MSKHFTYTNAEQTQVRMDLDTADDRHGHFAGPIQGVGIGMAPGNKEFDELFPNAVTKVDEVTRSLVLVEHGEPAFPITAYVEPVTVPASISDRQFFWGLYKKTLISRDEAMAAIKQGTTPPLIVKILAKIPNLSTRDDTEALIMGAKTIERARPETMQFAGAIGWDAAKTDDFFIYANTL